MHKLQALHFTKAKMAIIITSLVTNFMHNGVTLVPLALVHSTKPARFDSYHIDVSTDLRLSHYII